MALGLGIGIPFIRVSRGAAIDAQAQAHFDRVIADGGLVPSGLSGVNAFFTTIKTIYATSDITTAISVGLDAQVLGYKLGAGAGTTAGQAAQKLYSCSGASGDVVQTTAASQPLLLVHEGANYWFGSGVTGNFVSTPNAAANQIVGDLDIYATIPLATQGAESIIVSKYASSSTISYVYVLRSDRTLRLYLSLNGSSLLTYNSTSAYPIGSIYTRVTRNKTLGEIKFFTSVDGVTYTQLGATITGVTTSDLFNSTSVLSIGAALNGNVSIITGAISRVTLANTIGGTPVVDFNPNQYNAATSQTQWTSSTGEVWTINTGTAATGYKGQIVTKTIVQSDGIDDIMGKNSAFTSTKNLSVYSAKKSFNITNNRGYISSSVNPGEMTLSDISFFIGNSTFSPTGISTLLQFSALRQSSSNTSKVRYNANADTSGTPTTLACNRIILFGSPYAWDFGSPQYSNNILSTVIITSNYDSDATSAAIYNVIRSINENAF
jgi:hypothetical protein